MRFAIEVDCDARVLRRGADPRAYGEVLLLVGQRGISAPAGAIALTEPPSQLRRRIRIMTERRLPRGRVVMGGLAVLSVACVAMAAWLHAPAATIPGWSRWLSRASSQESAAGSASGAPASSKQAGPTAEATNTMLYDLGATASIQGTVRGFYGWGGPRTRLYLSVPDARGNRRVWDLEGISSRELRGRYQWTAQSLKRGDRVTVDFHPFRDAHWHGGIFIRVVTAEGRALSAGTAADFAAMNMLEYATTAPQNLQKAFGTKSAWEAEVTAQVNTPGEEELQSGIPSRSKICFVNSSGGTSDCTYFHDVFQSTLSYQTAAALSVIPLVKSKSPKTVGLLLNATAYYVSGDIHETAIWVYDARTDEFHLAASLESPELRIVSEGPLDGYLITADWNRAANEARWDDHRRDITVYRFDGSDGAGTYREVLTYTTAKKYGAEDTNTINSEIDVILRHLTIPPPTAAEGASGATLLWEPVPIPVPAAPSAKSESGGTRANPPISGIQLDDMHVALDETPFGAVQRRLGGMIGHNGKEAGNSLSWICFDARKLATPSVIWLESGELYHNDVVAGFQWRSVTHGFAIDARCQAVPSADQIRLPVAIRLGDTVAQVRTALGTPTSESKTVMFYAVSRPSVRANTVWTTLNTIAIQIQDGTVRAIEAWMSTTN